MKARLLVFFLISGAAVIFSRAASAAPWLEEAFDSYSTGSLNGQGGWTGNTNRITVVTTTSLTGRAACLDADENPMLPVVYQLQRPVTVPIEGRHVFSFAVRVETPTAPFGQQAAMALATSQTEVIELQIFPTTVTMTLRNEWLDITSAASWDLGTVAGGAPDLTTGTFHLFEVDLDFGKANEAMDDFVRDVRLDGQSQAHLFSSGLPGYICVQSPMCRLVLVNGATVGGPAPDAVFFDNVVGRPGWLAARHWHLY